MVKHKTYDFLKIAGIDFGVLLVAFPLIAAGLLLFDIDLFSIVSSVSYLGFGLGLVLTIFAGFMLLGLLGIEIFEAYNLVRHKMRVFFVDGAPINILALVEIPMFVGILYGGLLLLGYDVLSWLPSVALLWFQGIFGFFGVVQIINAATLPWLLGGKR